MTAKEYLLQIRFIDNRIAAKREQAQYFYDQATKCTTTWSDMPPGQPNGRSRMADYVMKMIELENEMTKEMMDLANLKKQIMDTINKIDNMEYKTILEERYLSFKSWEQISEDMGYTVRHIYRLHGRALLEVEVPKN